MTAITTTVDATSATQLLGRFIHDLTLECAPEELVTLTRMRVLDAVGAAYAGRMAPISRLTQGRAAGRPTVEGGSRYWMTDRLGDPFDVAFSNSVLVHSVLMEDVGIGGHPGCNVIPTALAVAEEIGASGAQIMEAVIAGYEVQTRIAADFAIYKKVGDRGLRGTTVTGAFGAAATAAKLYGLSAKQCASALAFAASVCAPGIEQPILQGSDERMLQMANNTRSGLLAAHLARDGYVGAELALEGECGFYSAYVGQTMPSGVIAGLGETWTSISDDLWFKSHPTAGMNVGPIYVAEKLLEEGTLSAGDLADIESISIMMMWWRVNTAYISAGPFDTFEQAILSGPLGVCSTLLYGSYSVENLLRAMADPAVQRLVKLVHCDGSPTWNNQDGALTIVMKDGQSVYRTAGDMPHSIWDPSWDQVIEKFHRSVSGCLDRNVQDHFVAAIAGLAELDDASSLSQLLATTRLE